MTSRELVLFRGSAPPSKSVGLMGLTAVLGSQAAPLVTPYAKELFYRILLAVVERLFRSVESLAIRYLRLDAETHANALPSPKVEPEPSSADSEGPKKPKTVEMLEEKRSAAGQPPCPFGPSGPASMRKGPRGPRGFGRHWRESRNAQMNAVESYDPPEWMRLACITS